MANAARIEAIEAEMARTQKNKATMYHLCQLKAQLAQLKRQEIERQFAGGGGGGDGWDVKATGDARVGLIGFPSVGKSTLLTKMTGTHSEAAAYEFTTLTCIPGIIRYKGAKIQLLDLPGIIEGAKDGKGRGKRVIGTARTCTLILLVLDSSKPVTHKKLIEKELHGFGIRLNQRKPNVYFKRHDKGARHLWNAGHADPRSSSLQWGKHHARPLLAYPRAHVSAARQSGALPSRSCSVV
jgi:small GTP-binding protein